MNARILGHFAIAVAFAVLFFSLVHTALAQGSTPPQPLPHDCGGVTPIDQPPPACCAYGYVYDSGVPIQGAAVTMQGDHGVVTTTTGSGYASTAPYYQVNLQQEPLNVSVGDSITVTASYQGRRAVRTHVVGSGSQQIDLVALTAGVDLTVQGITLDPPNPASGEPVTVTVSIINQGDVAASAFSTYLYIDPTDRPPKVATPDTSYTSIYGLGAGAFYSWSTSDITFAQGCRSVYAWVDKDNQIVEADEGNNLATYASCSGCTSDAYEDDDSCGQARNVSVDGVRQERNLCPAGDQDWIKFTATQGITYTIEAASRGADARMVLSLYNICTTSPTFGTGARIVWSAPANGTYYLKTNHHDEDYGPDTRYDLSITATPGASTVKTLILVNRERVSALYGESEAAALMQKLAALADYPAAPGAIVQVENEAVGSPGTELEFAL